MRESRDDGASSNEEEAVRIKKGASGLVTPFFCHIAPAPVYVPGLQPSSPVTLLESLGSSQHVEERHETSFLLCRDARVDDTYQLDLLGGIGETQQYIATVNHT